MWKVVHMNLGFVRARTHHPVTVFAGPNAVACTLELEVLEKFDAACIFWILFETALALSCQPFWERPCC